MTLCILYILVYIGAPNPPVSIGAAVGITFSLTAVFFTMFGILIGLLTAWLFNRCGPKSTTAKEEAYGTTVITLEETNKID